MTSLQTENRNGLRFYLWGTNECISVTSVLSLVTVKDFSQIMSNYEQKNGVGTWDIYINHIMLTGTYLHYNIGCELALEARIPKPEFEPFTMIPEYKREDLQVMMSYWSDFKHLSGPKAYHGGIERFLHHSSGYAGRVDLVCQFSSLELAVENFPNNVHVLHPPHPEDVWLVDLKSSKGVYDGYRAQVWAYYQAWNERFPHNKATRMAVLRCGHNGWDFVETSGDQGLWDMGMREARKQGLIHG